ncbi:MAG: hypothetical protein CL797_05490 [Chromatiales bacterium]|nr:hypothetical protein [Chromatiales bacterium]
MNDGDSSFDWSSLVLGDWIARLDRMALKRFGEQVIADEAVNHVLEKLSANNWSALGGYKNKSKPINYLNVVATHLLEEFSRMKFGRPRPPVWLKKNGHLWVSIWRQICLERRVAGQVVFNWINEERSKEYLENIVRLIKARMPWCGVKRQEIPSSYLEKDGESPPFDVEDTRSFQETQKNEDLEELLLIIRLLIDPESDFTGITESQTAKINNIVTQLHKELELSDSELLMLKMVFIERIKQGLVAKAFDLKPYQLSKRLKALMMRLRSGLGAVGFDKEQFF